jgi:hypothetical protein
MPDPAPYSVAFVRSESELPEALWSACFTPQQEGQWWCRLIESAGVERQFGIFYAVLREGERQVGIAPLFTMELPLEFLVPDWLVPKLALIGKLLPSLSQPQILFVGSPGADEGAIGLLPGVDRRAAMLVLQRTLEAELPRRGAMMVLWKDFPPAYDADFAWLTQQTGLFRMTSFPGAVIDLPTGKREDYLAAMKSSRRYNLRRKLKESARRFDAEVEVVQQPDAATLDEIYALFAATRDRGETSFERLDRRFFERCAGEPRAHFLLLRERASRHLAAFMLCFDLGGAVINKYIGLDYARPHNWFLLFRLIDAAIDWSLARGARVFQSGQTGYSAKLEQGHRLIPLTSYGKNRNWLFHRIAQVVAARVSWATLDADLAEYVKAHPGGN